MASSVSAPTKLPFLSLLLTLFIFLGSFIATTTCIKATHESDRVLNLPGQPSSPPLSHFSGYITVNQDHGRALFYWFFEAQSHPSIKPLLLWFNGGPGCSSIGHGAAVELGPLRVNASGSGLEFNKHSWNKEANMLFVESPVGVGFSYTNTSADFTKLDDVFVAEDVYNFLVNWMKRFPHFKNHDVFISGESYAAVELLTYPTGTTARTEEESDGGEARRARTEEESDGGEARRQRRHGDTGSSSEDIMFLSWQSLCMTEIRIQVGNPETNDYYDSKGLLEYAWSHSVISDQEFENAKKVCNFKVSDWSGECNAAMRVVFEKYHEIDIYNIYAPICLRNTSGSGSGSGSGSDIFSFKTQNYGLRRVRIGGGGGYDPCFSTHTQHYFNRVDVQTSLHANTRGGANGFVNWNVCNHSVFVTYNFTVFSVLPIYTKLIKGGLKIWIYSGDTDGRVPVIGSRYCIEALGLPLKSPWRSWYHNHQSEELVTWYLSTSPAKHSLSFTLSYLANISQHKDDYWWTIPKLIIKNGPFLYEIYFNCNKMENKFLTDFLLVYIEKKITKNFTTKSIIEDFQDMKER
ncbi:hypothetical protein HYC85_012779 [Camellia sinensis]|uniref:Carboxypeptidase n=1 Tax=Camellia sinensis TaxID=4442 RepID=A0A7J7HG16_CAMSI|nr:hypothetical protein HYC85_012779 [Camellia sinensis]